MQLSKFFKDDAEVTPENLGEAIQQAIEIEIATIPVYLYTYYSVNRVPNQDAISGALVQELTGKGMSLPLAELATVSDLESRHATLRFPGFMPFSRKRASSMNSP